MKQRVRKPWSIEKEVRLAIIRLPLPDLYYAYRIITKLQSMGLIAPGGTHIIESRACGESSGGGQDNMMEGDGIG